MECDINKIITNIKNENKISISYLQKTFFISFIKAREIFNELIEKGYINSNGSIAIVNLSFLNKEKVIFLDVDGVLNSLSTKDRCEGYIGIEDKKVALLKEIVDATGACIVLVSSWKDNWTNNIYFKKSQDGMAVYLEKKLAKQGLSIIDKTIDGNEFYRGKGILRYIEMQKEAGINIKKFVILDDGMYDYLDTKMTKHLVQTVFEQNGLEEKHVRKAIQKLS